MKKPGVLFIGLFIFDAFAAAKGQVMCKAGPLECTLKSGHVQAACICNNTSQGVVRGLVDSKDRVVLRVSYQCVKPECPDISGTQCLTTDCPGTLVSNIKIVELDENQNRFNYFYEALPESTLDNTSYKYPDAIIPMSKPTELIRVEIPNHVGKDNQFNGKEYQNEAFQDVWTSGLLQVTAGAIAELHLVVQPGGFFPTRCFIPQRYCRFFYVRAGRMALDSNRDPPR